LSRRHLVIDASAAVYLASLAEMPPDIAGFDLVAPPNFPSERTSALTAAIYRGELPNTAADELFERLEAMSVRVIDDGTLHRREAFDLARSLGWAKTYDAEYVVLARRLECALLTTDARLERGARRIVEILVPTSFA
jgi:predicted nucleic acid-binding protein